MIEGCDWYSSGQFLFCQIVPVVCVHIGKKNIYKSSCNAAAVTSLCHRVSPLTQLVKLNMRSEKSSLLGRPVSAPANHSWVFNVFFSSLCLPSGTEGRAAPGHQRRPPAQPARHRSAQPAALLRRHVGQRKPKQLNLVS